MTATVTCVWTNDPARRLYERYEVHRADILGMLAIPTEMQGPSTIGTAGEIEIRAQALVSSINREMRELVQNFTMPAAIVPKA